MICTLLLFFYPLRLQAAYKIKTYLDYKTLKTVSLIAHQILIGTKIEDCF